MYLEKSNIFIAIRIYIGARSLKNTIKFAYQDHLIKTFVQKQSAIFTKSKPIISRIQNNFPYLIKHCTVYSVLYESNISLMFNGINRDNRMQAALSFRINNSFCATFINLLLMYRHSTYLSANAYTLGSLYTDRDNFFKPICQIVCKTILGTKE